MASQWVGSPVKQPGSEENQLYVLVEEEAVIRTAWVKVAERKGLYLAVFDSPDEFIANLNWLPKSARFYLDQDFGRNNRGVGVALAKLIKRRIGAFTCLVTAYDPDDFIEERLSGILDGVEDKYPEPFNATDQEITASYVEAYAR